MFLLRHNAIAFGQVGEVIVMVVEHKCGHVRAGAIGLRNEKICINLEPQLYG